ncbi:MAG: enoyl-CoA hydratase/isomerase family protein [Rhizomicrobium sp.]
MSIDFDLQETGVAVITINRPERLNAMDAEHYAGLTAAWTRVRDDDDVRVAIITGAGDKSFTVGADIKTFLRKKVAFADMWKTQNDMLLNRGIEVWKPVIAAVNGYALGGGVTLMLATDIRVACAGATFNVAEVKRGVLAGNGGTQRLIRQLPYAIAMELLLTGDTITAAQAERWGLINRVVPTAADVLPAAMVYAKRIAENAPLAVQATKEMAIRSWDMPLATGIRMETLSGRLLSFTEDAVEGPAAFAEKRKPKFKGQ